jgi:AcrR family transcriptional regulator
MVASVDERGYAATRLADLVELSGVSRRSFYLLFPDKEACFAAATEAIVGVAIEVTFAAVEEVEPWEQQVRRCLDALVGMVTEQPAAARLCLIEAYAAGPPAREPVEAGIAKVERLVQAGLARSPQWAYAPPELVAALIGGALEIVRTRLSRGAVAELAELAPALMAAMLAYRPPPQPLRLATRPPTPDAETIAAHDHGERALRAFAAVVAERGYASTTIDQVVSRAGMSTRTFYASFSGKEDALMAAIDSAGAQITAAVLPPFRRNLEWPQAVRVALGALFNFLASRPALSRLLLVEVYVAGPAAVERRSAALRSLAAAVVAGHQEHHAAPPLAFEVIASSAFALAYRQIRRVGAESLSALAPACTYLTLAPFLGPERACEVANADGRSRAQPAALTSEKRQAAKVLDLLEQHVHYRPMRVEELAGRLGMTTEEVEKHIAELEQAQMVESAGSDDAPELGGLYRARMHWIEGPEWERMSRAEREGVSEQIGYLMLNEVSRSAAAGTFDGRPDRHLSRYAISVDAQGWKQLLEIHNEALSAASRVAAEAADRLRGSSEEPINARSYQAFFEMPEKPVGETD